MATDNYSQFAEDVRGVLAGVASDILTTVPWVAANMVYVDRAWIEPPEQNCAVIVPISLNMGGQEEERSSVPGVEQVLKLRIFLKKKISPGDNVILEKVQALSDLTAVLMASNRYKGTWELPFVSDVDLEEEKPNLKYWVGSLDFTVRWHNFRHASV